MISLTELLAYTDTLLDSAKFQDYCPNGLQVAGREEVRTLVTGVTASLALVEAAIAAGADALLVHHGYFWKNENPRITGMKKRRLQKLLAADLSLLAYHLPLDAHPLYGNNAQLGLRLNIQPDGALAADPLVFTGHFDMPVDAGALAEKIAHVLQRQPLHVAGSDKPIRRIAWCSGGCQGRIELAADAGVDAYLTGEVSEATVHIARECGIHFFAAGHHASERYGVQALGAHLATRFGIAHRFIEIENPA